MNNPNYPTDLPDDTETAPTQRADLTDSAERIARAILRGETFVALIGEPTSTGRALTALVASFETSAVDFVCVADPSAGVGPIRRIIDQLGRGGADLDDEDEAWAERRALRTVLVIQQAERLRGEVLEFLNLSAATDVGSPLLQFLFVGQPAFLSRLDGAAFTALRGQIVTRVAVAEPHAPPRPREPLPAVRMPPPGPSWRRSQARTAAANRLAMRVQNAILLSLAIAATVAIGAIVQQRHREPGPLAGASLPAAKPPATAAATPTAKPVATAQATPPAPRPPPAPVAPAVAPPHTAPAPSQSAAAQPAPVAPRVAGPLVPPPPHAPPPAQVAAAAPVASAPDDVPPVPPKPPVPPLEPQQRDFDTFLKGWGGSASRLSPAQRERLYREFLDWRRNRAENVQPVAAGTDGATFGPGPRRSRSESAEPAAAGVDGASYGHRIVIGYRAASSVSEAAASQIAASLDPAAGSTELRGIDNVPSAPTVRYYSNEDRSAARQLAAMLGGVTGNEWQVSAAGSPRTRPPSGTIEILLPD